MTQQDLKLQEAEELLPWYLNGSLSEAERETVERALEAEPALRAELESLALMRDTVKEDSDSLAVPAGDFDLVMQRIDGVEPEAAPARATPAPTRASWMEQLGELFSLPALRFAGIAAALVIMVQSAAIVGLMQVGDEPGAVYETATTGDPAAATAEAGARMLVVFEDQAALSDIAGLLRELDARIVDGPSQAGGYILLIGGAEADPEAILQRLQARDDLVRFAGKAS